MCRDSSVTASTRLGVTHEVVAFDLDSAVTLRLMAYDNEKERANKHFLATMIQGSEVADKYFGD